MNERNGKVHWSFWLIGGLALLWHIGGCANYLSQMNTDFVATLPESHRAIIDGRPAWATGGFAIAVFGGAIASLLLLLRKSVAFYGYVVSLAGVLLTMIHTVQVATGKYSFSGGEIFIMVILPIIVSGLLIWYSKTCEKKLWIR